MNCVVCVFCLFYCSMLLYCVTVCTVLLAAIVADTERFIDRAQFIDLVSSSIVGVRTVWQLLTQNFWLPEKRSKNLYFLFGNCLKCKIWVNLENLGAKFDFWAHNMSFTIWSLQSLCVWILSEKFALPVVLPQSLPIFFETHYTTICN